jgi:cell division protein FtsL
VSDMPPSLPRAARERVQHVAGALQRNIAAQTRVEQVFLLTVVSSS